MNSATDAVHKANGSRQRRILGLTLQCMRMALYTTSNGLILTPVAPLGVESVLKGRKEIHRSSSLERDDRPEQVALSSGRSCPEPDWRARI